VVELKNGEVRLAAVDARVGLQVLDDERVVSLAIAVTVGVDVRDVLFSMLSVPSALTRAAVVLEPGRGRGVEGVGWKRSPAASARSNRCLNR
jgi:hypothetical protein